LGSGAGGDRVPSVLMVHVVAAALAPVIGVAQLSPRVRRSWPRAHRWLGRFYIGVCVIIGGGTGVWIGLLAHGGAATRLGFVLLSLAWLGTGAMAVARVVDGDIDGHREWMWRNYSLTLAAVTLRVYMGVAQELLGYKFEEAYPVVAWAAWVPNLVVGEWVVRRGRQSRATRARLATPRFRRDYEENASEAQAAPRTE
jgi:uncharacterized membrane protein